VHGDYHLGQVLRTDAGWYVLDFEGEPARPLEERRRPTSALKDVAGMLRSFHYASAVARTERDAEELDELAAAWEERNREAFLRGYLRAAGPGGVLPPDPDCVGAVMAAFELEKAVYELGYERAYRPDWEAIPLAALRRLTGEL
jgi:maltokinase